MTQDIAEFLKQAAAEGRKTDPKARYELWARHVDELYVSIQRWISAAIAEGSVTNLRFETKYVVEDLIGSYEMKGLAFDVGPQQIQFSPVGTYVVGAFGRVDASGPKGVVALVLVDRPQQGLAWAIGRFQPTGLRRRPVMTDPRPSVTLERPNAAYKWFDQNAFLEVLQALLATS